MNALCIVTALIKYCNSHGRRASVAESYNIVYRLANVVSFQTGLLMSTVIWQLLIVLVW